MLTITILVGTVSAEPLPIRAEVDYPPEPSADEAAISDEELEQILTIKQHLEKQRVRWTDLQMASAQ